MEGNHDTSRHWDAVYRQHESDELSWFQLEPVTSLQLIGNAGLLPDARIIDVGGGDPRLVDRLLDDGFRAVTVVDMSVVAIERSRLRLAERADKVEWIVGDITRFEQAVISTFSLSGPSQCSGLEVVRYSTGTLSHLLGSGFELAESTTEIHVTPAGRQQSFLYGRFSRRGGSGSG